ncbi:hypothetical protein [Chondromyces crocatus]|uniref:Uncharacterized protein n=1 Tax=Chondromyces crocatus TaxID=52 RepID=A0A0K1EAM1_CHOCO|nr:hypothetical protein [Chondromyces crocatus]AKT37931.1 uncharacterized protein CMC5_020740 [Chondromyces crocatus]
MATERSFSLLDRVTRSRDALQSADPPRSTDVVCKVVFADDEVWLVLPIVREIIALDATDLSLRRAITTLPSHAGSQPDLWTLAVAGSSVVVTAFYPTSHTEDATSGLIVLDRASGAVRFLVEPEAFPMEWALSPSGDTLVVAVPDEGGEGPVLARVYSTLEKTRPTRFTIRTGEDPFLSAVAIDASGEKTAFAIDDHLVEFEQKKRHRKRDLQETVGTLLFSAHSPRLFGIEQGERGALCILHPPSPPLPATRALLQAQAPIAFLSLSADEETSLWLGTDTEGARRLFALSTDDGTTRVAENLDIEPNALVAVDAAHTRIARVLNDRLTIAPLQPVWRPLV